jgi:DNA-binding FadR family transcriptional regulator
LIVVGGHSPTLIGVYEQLHRWAQILELCFTDNWDSYRESLGEHGEIVKLLSTAPMETVEAAVWDHWQRSRSRISTRFSRLAGSPNSHLNTDDMQPGGTRSWAPADVGRG